MVFGTGRLFDNNEGPNVKLSFDGFRLIAEGSRARLDLFAVKSVENNLGFFDDVPNHAETLLGSYLTVPAPIVSRGQADFYYIGVDTKSATYNRGTAHEVRYTVGTRVFRPVGKGLDYNWEPNFQWGSFGSASIRAWSVSTETGFTLDRARFHPRPLLRADVYSGDGNPANQPFGTFNPLFPVAHTLPPRWSLSSGRRTSSICIRRFNFTSGLTSPEPSPGSGAGGNQRTTEYMLLEVKLLLIRPTPAARYLGTQGDLEIRWSPAPHIIMAFNFAGFKPGSFFNTLTDNAGPIAANVDFTYRF